MSLLHYIQGHRKGKKAHRIELEAMHDPFMADALEGYENVSGNHTDAIKQMQDAVHRRSRLKNRSFTFWASIAASILLAIGAGWYLLKSDASQIPVLSDAELSPSGSKEVRTQPQARINEAAQKETEITNPVLDGIPTEDRSILADMNVQKIVIPPPPSHEEFSQMPEISEVWADSMQDEEMQQVEEVVVIGYAARKSQSKTDAVTPVSTDDLKLVKIRAADKDQPATGAASTSNNDLKNEASAKEAPSPVIGWKAYKKYLRKNIVHPPTDDTCANVKGNVEISFLVDSSGRPYNQQVTKSLCETADQEAIRLISTGSNWTTGNTPVTVIVKF